jgi:hypothetical protein
MELTRRSKRTNSPCHTIWLGSDFTHVRHPPKRTQDSKEGRARAAFGGTPMRSCRPRLSKPGEAEHRLHASKCFSIYWLPTTVRAIARSCRAAPRRPLLTTAPRQPAWPSKGSTGSAPSLKSEATTKPVGVQNTRSMVWRLKSEQLRACLRRPAAMMHARSELPS